MHLHGEIIAKADTHHLFKEPAGIGGIINSNVGGCLSQREIFVFHKIDQRRNTLTADIFERRALQIPFKDAVQIALGDPQMRGKRGNGWLIPLDPREILKRSFYINLLGRHRTLTRFDEIGIHRFG